MSVHIHLSVADLFKMAAAEATATAAANAAAHQEEIKKLQQIIDEQKMEIRRLNQESFASSVAVSQVCDAKIKELTDKLHHAEAAASDADGVAAAAASDAAADARLRQETRHQEELKELRQLIEKQKMEITHLKWDSFAAAAKERAAFDTQTKELNDRLNDAVYQHDLCAKQDATTIRHLRTALDDALDAEQDAQECAKKAEEDARELKAELVRMNVSAEEVAREKKAAYNDLVSRFDTSTTFYKMKLEEAEEIRERLEKELKEDGETLDEVSRRECALGQRTCEATLRAEKAEANFLRLCGAIDTAMKAYPQSRKELWDHYMSTE